MRMSAASLFPIALALAACAGTPGGGGAPDVNYSKVMTEQIESSSSVALTVEIAEGQEGKASRKARRNIGSILHGNLLGNQMFKEVRHEGEEADYQLNVVVVDILAGQEQLDSVVAYNAAAAAGIKAIDAINARQEANEAREVEVQVTLLRADGTEEVTAFTTSAAGGTTELTAFDVVQQIIGGLECQGEGCV